MLLKDETLGWFVFYTFVGDGIYFGAYFGASF
jgi:hypothetical protein